MKAILVAKYNVAARAPRLEKHALLSQRHTLSGPRAPSRITVFMKTIIMLISFS